jgi:hypothetical protein
VIRPGVVNRQYDIKRLLSKGFPVSHVKFCSIDTIILVSAKRECNRPLFHFVACHVDGVRLSVNGAIVEIHRLACICTGRAAAQSTFCLGLTVDVFDLTTGWPYFRLMALQLPKGPERGLDTLKIRSGIAEPELHLNLKLAPFTCLPGALC